MSPSTLFLLPAALGDTEWQSYLPSQAREIAITLDYFIVEKAKTVRAELKRLGLVRPLREIAINELAENPSLPQIDALLAPLTAGKSAGLMSEAGCPGVADPGALVVRRAHEIGLRVVPLVGPSSILLALMASGLNGQNFCFHGYLPVREAERLKKIQELERESVRLQRTQIFIETPYRNQTLFEALLAACQPATLLCVATHLTLGDECIATHPISAWRKLPLPQFDKKPTVFLILAT